MESDTESWETASSDLGVEGSHRAIIEAPPPLHPISPKATHPDDKLCDTCAQLALDVNQFVILPGGPNHPDNQEIFFGNVEDVRRKEACPLCRLVLQALGGDKIPAFEDGEPVCIYLTWDTDGSRPDPGEPWGHIPEIRILRPDARPATGTYLRSTKLNLFPEITLLANDSPIPSTACFVRPILHERIDFSLVRRWLSICELCHKHTCTINPVMKELGMLHPADEIPEFRVIDVELNCLVRGMRGCRYTALSYVWGRTEFFRTLLSNVEDLERPQSLAKPEYLDLIPQTIKDAMEVNREIGIRYLWVDSLCIVQDDDKTDHKITAIKKMDLVYSAAHLVIVAASSSDAYAGIPGIHPGTRGIQQPIEEISPGLRLAFKTRWQDYIEDASYYTRGWT